MQRIERSHRLLKHDSHVVAAYAAYVALGQRQQIAAFEHDCAGGMLRGRVGQELQYRQCRDRFARSGLADQRQRLALADVERHAVDRESGAAAGHKSDGKVTDREEGFGHADNGLI
jgi:hypothetical protein